MKICQVCNKGTLVRVDDIVLEISGYVFVVKGERCDDCNEEFIDEKETQKTITIARKLGIWPEPLKLYRKLSKSGKGLVFRVPNDLERQLGLKEGKEIAISKLGNKILIEP
ncbi:MAG: hypothetical protein AABX45_02360 [Nanoarchaeota archaeon]